MRTTSGSLLIFSSGTAGTICALGRSVASRPPIGACNLQSRGKCGQDTAHYLPGLQQPFSS